MAKYINKDALVAEIERRIKEHHSGYLVCLKDILSFLDTIEVKGVDFHNELLSFYRHTNDSGSEIALAKHFYELGFKAAQNEHKSCTTYE